MSNSFQENFRGFSFSGESFHEVGFERGDGEVEEDALGDGDEDDDGEFEDDRPAGRVLRRGYVDL